jgi:hypothetical protein
MRPSYAMRTIRVVSLALVSAALACVPALGQAVGSTAPNCPSSAYLQNDTSSGATLLIPAPTGSALQTYMNGYSSTAPRPGNITGPSVHICSVQYRVNQAGTAANYGLVAGYVGAISAATWSTQTLTQSIVGTSTQTCTVSLLDTSGRVSATGTIALTGTNAIAGSTAMSAIVPTEGYVASGLTVNTSGQAVTANLGSGTATCSGQATLAATTAAATAVCQGSISIGPQWFGVASSATDGAGMGQVFGKDVALKAPPNSNVCFNLSAAPTGSQVHVTYSVY